MNLLPHGVLTTDRWRVAAEAERRQCEHLQPVSPLMATLIGIRPAREEGTRRDVEACVQVLGACAAELRAC
jgi:hypothetical protein